MSRMQYKYIHDCPKPDMVIGKETYTVGMWWWKKTQTIEVYDTRQIVWTCDCGAQWNWSAFSNKSGYWLCNFRPNIWRDIEC